MSRVSDMVKMYSQSQLRSAGQGANTGTARKWPPVATSGGPSAGTRPSTTPKPYKSNDNSHSVENIPPWKLELQKLKGSGQANQVEEPKQETGWNNQRNSLERENKKEEHRGQENKPQWKINLERAKAESEKPKEPAWKKPDINKPKTNSSWLNRNQEHSNNDDGASSHSTKPNPPWMKPSADNNRPSHLHNKFAPPPRPAVTSKPKPTTTWGARNRSANEFTNGGNSEEDLPPPPPSDSGNSYSGDSLAPSRANPQHKSFSYNSTPKAHVVEKSSGSFGSATSPKPVREQESPKHRVSSFLHTKPAPPKPPTTPTNFQEPSPPRTPSPPPSNEKPKKTGGPPRKLPLPKDIFLKQPPKKTSKPPHVVLPNKGKKKSTPLPPPPMSSRALPSPVPSGFPTPPPNLPSRPGPDLPSRPLPSPTPTKMSMPLPPPPAETIQDDVYDDPGEAPPRPPPKSSGGPPLPPLPSGGPPLPPLPSGAPSLPSLPSGARPPPINSMPPPLVKQQSSGLIPTWSDEDEAIYDETPDEPPPPAKPPAGFPMPGVPQIQPDGGEEMYEDLDEYMKLKLEKEQRARSTNGSVTSSDAKEKKEKEKKKKDSEKREKDIKKKFKIEGEIVPEGYGVVKENCKGSGKNLAVSAGENIDVIRMMNNPKGKWLIRNAQGDLGYVDSDKVTINIDQLRNQFGVGSRAPSGIVGGPPVPAIIPTMAEDEEVIYDQTAEDEDVYEEL